MVQDSKKGFVARRRLRGPADLPGRSWWGVIKRSVGEFQRDNLTDWAAALTYYSVLSLFPGLIVMTAGLGMLGRNDTRALVDTIREIGPGSGTDLLVDAVNEIQEAQAPAGPLALLGLASALWTASAYIGAFMRATNAIYDIQEGRPIWKTVPVRVALTAAVVILLGVCTVGVVVSGSLADRIGGWLGLAQATIAVWDIVKWPVMMALISLVFALLYWAAPNVRQPGFRWLTPGSALAVLLWAGASWGFAFYVGHFGSYNRVYGSLGGVVVFLVWLWISNIAVLLGAELDAELARARNIAHGHPEDAEPYLPPRDDPGE
ncbi:YihY/virulence factor BrkB family protein [Nocardia sp. NPDC005745]|uniref:YihY/virulence factor BrkB family protein n=1 Tax=Nocardia sp. NPDC005745 TaxID=3157061 RepID=UPI0033FEDFC9